VHRANWLRAAVLGANDGIVSTASLIVGVAAANSSQSNIILVGMAGLVAGAMSMAAGEYVSVSSQSDAERADLEKERRELAEEPEHEHAEMAAIYVERGLDEDLAAEVATQLMDHDALGAHARDELGIIEEYTAKPFQAAVTSAASFVVGALLPMLVVFLVPLSKVIWAVPASALVSLGLLGALAARVGGAPVLTAALRVFFWGALAMLLTAIVGYWFA
tara:strand:+ start:30842 stop:31498 length:657 start_codon:yes stop_codon:yes gene_type:complete